MYTKTNWIDNDTPLSAANLNKMEQGIEDAHNEIENVNESLADILSYTLERTNKDSEGIFTTITHKRDDNTKILESVLSGGTTPKYTTRTVTYYGTNGTTVLKTEVYTLTYDADDVLISEVLA